MAKIRGVKPEFWTADGIMEMSIPARLLYIGLWNYACDNGHLADKPRQIKTRILPGDDVKVGELLDEMVGAGQIVRANGWITIPDLTHHQKPHKRWWQTCDMPGCVVPEGASHAPANRGATVATPLQTGGTTVSNGCATADGDGEGDGDGEVKKPRKRATSLPSDWKPTEKHWERRHDGIDVQREAEKFRLHAEASGRRMVNWNAAFSQWLLNARPSPTVARPLMVVEDESLLPPVEDSWMRRRPTR